MFSVIPDVPPMEKVAPLAVVIAVESVAVAASTIVAIVMPGAMPGPVTCMPVCSPAVGILMVVEFVFAAVLTTWAENPSWPFAPLRVVVPPFSVVAPK